MLPLQVGTSLGGTVCADYALAYPEAVRQLVLVDAQGFSDGVQPLPRPLAWVGVEVLRRVWLREKASQVRGPLHLGGGAGMLMLGTLQANIAGSVHTDGVL